MKNEHEAMLALIRVAKALLMFYEPSFDGEAWKKLTGRDEATTKVLGDLAREALAKVRGEEGTS